MFTIMKYVALVIYILLLGTLPFLQVFESIIGSPELDKGQGLMMLVAISILQCIFLIINLVVVFRVNGSRGKYIKLTLLLLSYIIALTPIFYDLSWWLLASIVSTILALVIFLVKD